MSENWKNILVRFRKSVKKAEAHLCNSKGQNIVGVHQISFKTLILKFVKEEFKADDEKIVYLCCNLVNHMQKKIDGTMSRTDSAISIIHLKAAKIDEVRTFSLENHPYFKFSDKNVIQCWLKDISGEAVDHEKIQISVLCSYSKVKNKDERRILFQPSAST